MKYCLYTHIGSGNRGCEATARALQNLLNVSKECFWVFSENNEEENICNTESYATVLYTPMVQGLHPMTSLVPRLLTKLNIDRLAGVRYRYKKLFKGIESDDIGLSTGGDVFCYDQELSNKIGYLTKEFNSILEAKEFTGVATRGIRNVIYGKWKTAGGYHWKKELKEEYKESQNN